MPSKSQAQHGAMCAACHGESTLGIPHDVGCEFCSADRGKKLRRKHVKPKKLRRKKR